MHLSPDKIKNILADPQAGFYLLDKAKGEHSFAYVALLRRLLALKKVGFAGTLDPLASGLLILASGSATKLLDIFHEWPKKYLAEITFGKISTTYDLEGEIEEIKSAQAFSLADLQTALLKLTGEIDQQAPLYSAKKINGQKLNNLARKGKKITPPISRVIIYDYKIIDFSYPILQVEIKVSKGTYIRSLAHDLGQLLGTGALLSDLRRTSIGDFKVANALPKLNLSKEILEQEKIQVTEIIKFLD